MTQLDVPRRLVERYLRVAKPIFIVASVALAAVIAWRFCTYWADRLLFELKVPYTREYYVWQVVTNATGHAERYEWSSADPCYDWWQQRLCLAVRIDERLPVSEREIAIQEALPILRDICGFSQYAKDTPYPVAYSIDERKAYRERFVAQVLRCENGSEAREAIYAFEIGKREAATYRLYEQ